MKSQIALVALAALAAVGSNAKRVYDEMRVGDFQQMNFT